MLSSSSLRLLDKYSFWQHWRQEKGYDLYPVLRLLLPQVCVHMPKSYNLNEVSTRLLITEGPRTRSLRFEGEESCEDVYQAHSPRQERPRCTPFVELEEANGSWSMKFPFLVLQLQPTYQQKASGDFPTVLYEVVSKRSSVIEGGLSIDDLNHTLDEISQNMGKQYVSVFWGFETTSPAL